MIMIILSLLIATITAILIYIKLVYTHWQRHGFPYIKPSILLGNLGPVAKREMSFGINIHELYKSVNDPFIGVYLFFRPAILVRDVELIQQILATDFSHFHDRGIYGNKKYDPLSETLLRMRGQDWRNARSKLSPAFTSGKIKTMFTSILTQGDNLCDHLESFAKNNENINIKDWTQRYALNIIAASLFGLDVDTISNPNDEFKVIGNHMNSPEIRDVLGGIASFLCPPLVEWFRLPIVPKYVNQYVMNVVRQSVELRARDKNPRQDLMQFLIDLNDAQNENEKEKIEMIAAQVVLFYLAGVDTSSSGIAYAIFEMARNPDIVRKLRAEINSVLAKHNNEITYESLQEMHYLELCIKESIRKYPALPLLNRECTEDYKIPNSHLTIRKGTAIIISLLGQMRDEKYFPNALKYIPERYLEENQNYNATAYIPFGFGPRICIGARLGKLVVQTALVKLVQRFDFAKINDKEIEFENYSVPLVAKGGINVRISNRN